MFRRYLILGLSLLVGAVCIRLGFWQLSRLHERRQINNEALTRLALAPVDISGPDSHESVERFRRVRAAGTLDYTRAFVLTARSRSGSPGVYLFTPLVRPRNDTLLLVLGGWVYSPDATTINFGEWREPPGDHAEGYALFFPADEATDDSSALAPHAVRRLDRARLEKRLGAPIGEYYLVTMAGGPVGDSIPQRLGTPVVDEGPHLSYAIQWFFFAVIFGAGGTFVVLRSRYSTSSAGST